MVTGSPRAQHPGKGSASKSSSDKAGGAAMDANNRELREEEPRYIVPGVTTAIVS